MTDQTAETSNATPPQTPSAGAPPSDPPPDTNSNQNEEGTTDTQEITDGGSTEAAAPAPDPTPLVEVPKKRYAELPLVGEPVAVYGIEHDGRHVAAHVSDANEDEGTVNVSGARRNGQFFSYTHVPFFDDEGEAPAGVSATGVHAHYRKEQRKKQPATAAQQEQQKDS